MAVNYYDHAEPLSEKAVKALDEIFGGENIVVGASLNYSEMYTDQELLNNQIIPNPEAFAEFKEEVKRVEYYVRDQGKLTMFDSKNIFQITFRNGKNLFITPCDGFAMGPKAGI